LPMAISCCTSKRTLRSRADFLFSPLVGQGIGLRIGSSGRLRGSVVRPKYWRVQDRHLDRQENYHGMSDKHDDGDAN
jgi:hypothetical protein